MKATDLRLNNLVYNPYEEVTNIDIGILQAIHLMNRDGHKVSDFYKPIPLTEKHLKDFGFTPLEGWDGMVSWSAGKNIGTAFTIYEINSGYVNSNDKVIPYVHLLQNAYFFDQLDGSELTIKTLTA